MAVAPQNPPQIIQGASMATQPEGGITPQGQNFDKLKMDWMGVLRQPEVIASMLQLGASQLAGSNIGASLGEAAQAAAGTREAIQQRGAEAVKQNLATREIAGREAGQAEQVRANRAQETLAEKGLQQKQDEFTRSLGLEMQKLGIEQQRANAYAASVATLTDKRLRSIPGYSQAVASVWQNAAMAGDVGTPEYEDAVMNGMALVNKSFHLALGGGEGGTTGTTPGGAGESTVPASNAEAAGAAAGQAVGQQMPVTGGAQGLPTISTAMQYSALPPGAEYLDPQGNRRRKPSTAALP